MPASEPVFADFHFHTACSDNRDRASLEEMVLRGAERGLSVFGSGDHNHNLDRRAWRQGRRETSRLRRKYPRFLIFHNCEITFQLGHFLVLEPGKISGTAAEGYAFLLGRRRALTIVNHPDPAKDEWQKRLLPGAAGIEVITGAEVRKALAAGFVFQSVRELPFFRTLVNYLSLGFPVAALGNSDAHELAALGSGMTGLWLSGGFGREQVRRAIREGRTFATTDPGIRLHWGVDRERREFHWRVDWRPAFAAVAPGGFQVEVYDRDRRIRTAVPEGRTAAEPGGLYWIAAFDGRGLAVSSPARLQPAGDAQTAQTDDRAGRKLQALLAPGITDLRRLELRKRYPRRLSTAAEGGATTMDLLSAEPEPTLRDAAGRPVSCTIIEPGRRKVIMDKQCRFPCFEEFHLWLKRNEIHEYMFLDIDYGLEGDLFSFTGRVVPAAMLAARGFGRRFRGELTKLRALSSPDRNLRYSLRVHTLYRCTARIELTGHPLPLTLDEDLAGLRSILVGAEGDPSGRALKTFLGPRISTRSAGIPEPGLFQLFV